MLKLQNLISEMLNESVYDKGIFKAVFFSGIPGAGKSYTIEKITDGSIEPRIVNFDKYLEFLGKKAGVKDVGKHTDIIDRSFLDRSKIMSMTAFSLYVNSMLPLFIDSTSNRINRTLFREGLLSSFGYDTAMVYVNTPLEKAIERVRSRERTVPVSFIRSVYDSMQENVNYYKNRFPTFLEINNDEGEFDDKAILKAYKSISGFFREDIENPIGRRNRDVAEKTSGYLTPGVYKDVSEIKRKLTNWY